VLELGLKHCICKLQLLIFYQDWNIAKLTTGRNLRNDITMTFKSSTVVLWIAVILMAFSSSEDEISVVQTRQSSKKRPAISRRSRSRTRKVNQYLLVRCNDIIFLIRLARVVLVIGIVPSVCTYILVYDF